MEKQFETINPVECAYRILVEQLCNPSKDKSDSEAIEEAVGYLGQALA